MALLDRLAGYRTGLVLCAKEGKIAYRTALSPSEVRERLGPYRDLLLSLLRPGECREAREILEDPRRLARLLWLSGEERSPVVLTWVVGGEYKRLSLSGSEVPEFLWDLPSGTTRVHLGDLGGYRVVDVNLAGLQVLACAYVRTRRTECVVLADRARVNVFLASLEAVGYFREVKVWTEGSEGVTL